MQRKVIKQGNNTLTITLPKKWAQRVGLQSGDVLEVAEKQEGLLVSVSRLAQQKSKTVDISQFDLLIPRVIYTLYKKGYDELILSYSDKLSLSLIQKAMGKETIGYEIVKQGEKYCEIKNISEVLRQEFDPTLRRVFLSLQFMAQEGLQAARQNNMDSLVHIATMEETNNRLTTFCRRAINKYSYHEEENVTFLYCIIEALEKIADEYKYFYTYLLEQKGVQKGTRISKETFDLWEKVNLMLTNFYTLFYHFEAKRAVALAQERKKVVAKAYALFDQKSKEEARIIHHLITINQQLFNLLGPLMAMRL